MIAATNVIGIDVSRDWLDGFRLPGLQRFRLTNSPEGHEELISMICQMSELIQVGFEAAGGQEWALWAALVEAGVDARQLPPAQIKAFAMSRGTRAKTDRIDAELIAHFMVFRPEAGRTLPSNNLRALRALTTRRAQIVEMRKRLTAQISARKKQGIPADIEPLDAELKAMLDAQISDLEQRINRAISSEETSATKAHLLRSIPGIGPVSAAMAGLAPVPHDSGAMRGRRAIAGGRRALRHVLFQAALAAACHNPMLKTVAKRMKEHGKPHKVVIIAIARRLITIANAILKTGENWRYQAG